MPQPYYNAVETSEHNDSGLVPTSTTCPNPLTPPPEQEQYGTALVQDSQAITIDTMRVPVSDNTAAGMASSQEDSIYLSPVATPESAQHGFYSEDKERMDVMLEDCKEGTKTPLLVNAIEARDDIGQRSSVSSSPVIPIQSTNDVASHASIRQAADATQEHNRDTLTERINKSNSCDNSIRQSRDEAHARGLAPIDLLFDHSIPTKPWDFSTRRMLPEHPSHVFQSFSHYSGTQQSDRQIYNVDVTILTVDIAQCTMSGYLLIRGLTPEHDTLQTYFTGEIIGGPPKFSDEKQYHTFRTANPAWGATEKTDLTHWARFPAWRSLASHAKRDINFTYPTDGENWWEQENVFMRWKEHFLVPDHKTRSIAGASFEGFYYICLNQVQGRISGIYYHSKSEKYQQLELKHEGKPDIFNLGITPCVEFR